ncbi:MAG: LysM peptidoglycan-binding domain-containing protein [Firmicutes bacterium]|jgi:LysM repeat protein|nr:LysM peptidoglycan-binding domain-containing protein [Bacillota bacterium]HOB22197.1 LysM peptidoglycan-binding domain-containing protein [Bacillota bacterium]HQD40070.1 LysM peptidoglycan-binding domain-containing protein [Bacillota bacterium]
MPNGCPPGSRRYTIAAGDTLFSLAQRFGTTVSAITSLNPGIDPNRLRVGQVICIPGRRDPGPGPCPRNWVRYAIRPGDTLFAIAQRTGTTVQELINNNPGIDPNSLRVAQLICVPRGGPPRPGPCPRNWERYAIRAGDTLFSIAQRRGTTVAELERNNPGINPNSLQVGQLICVPRTDRPVPLPTPCPAGATHYTIRPGDTLFQLARARGTTVDAILRINPSLDPNSLRVGQIICLP